MRNIAAIFAGLAAGMAVNLALLQLNLTLFPPPPEIDLAAPEGFRELVAVMPAGAWVLVFAAHLGQSFVGAAVAARLASCHPMRLALVVGALSMAGGIANAKMLDLPAWAWVEMPFYLVVAWAAGKGELAQRAAADPPGPRAG